MNAHDNAGYDSKTPYTGVTTAEKRAETRRNQEFATRDKTDAGEGIETEVLLYHITLKGIL
ncbi:hypothetical protein [Raoultella terrigena]|uniref:hypothetical protein n=1 Tax=Raoultella terrigena TaxID=577 RepID=UPI00384E56D1